MNPALWTGSTMSCASPEQRSAHGFTYVEVVTMKTFGFINLGVLPLLLEAMSPLYAQRDPREQDGRRPQQEQQAKPQRQEQQGRPEGKESKPRPQEAQPRRQEQQSRPEVPAPKPRPQEAQPARQPQPARPARQEQPQPVKAPQQRQQQEAKGRQEQQQRQQPANRPSQQAQRAREGEHRTIWQGRQAQNWQSQHRTWQDRGGYRGYRIPDARFRGAFGPSHGFRMFSFPVLVIGGFPRFQYGGFWFSVMDPWPEYWSDNWYGDDDMYIEYWGGGYYLHNRRHPLDRIALTVYLH
jgi:hypothetical protein